MLAIAIGFAVFCGVVLFLNILVDAYHEGKETWQGKHRHRDSWWGV